MTEVEKAARRLERARHPEWTDEVFEIWWNTDPFFTQQVTNWGHFGPGTRKQHVIWEACMVLGLDEKRGDVTISIEYTTEPDQQPKIEEGTNMAELVWERDPDAVEGETEFIGKAGQVVLGSVRKSNHSADRWRWEICMMPGLGAHREDRSGWVASEEEAKKSVQDMWNGWLDAAGLSAE